MKKLLAMILALVMVFTMCACGQSSAPATEAPAAQETITAPAGFDWRRYEGTTISITGVEGVYNEQILEAIEPFQELTGITVDKVDFVPEADYTNKIQLLSSAKSDEYDVYMISFSNLFDFVPNGWIEPLDAYINDSTLADPELNMDDFYDSVLYYCYWDGVSGTPDPPRRRRGDRQGDLRRDGELCLLCV